MDRERLLEHERIRMQEIRELDMEELQIEEVDDDFDPSSSSDDATDPSGRGDRCADLYGGFTFDPCLASLHTYLGEVDDLHSTFAFLDGGAILNLPMFYLEGVVLFPESTLPLRVIQPRLKAAVERVLRQGDTSHTIGVVRIHLDFNGGFQVASTGTIAEIRQYRQLDDGTLNVVARGQQRFRVRRQWIDVDGVPYAEVQIVQEDIPLRTPNDAFGRLASVSNSRKFTFSRPLLVGLSPGKRLNFEDAEHSWEHMSTASAGSDHSDVCLRTTSDSSSLYERIDESSSSDEELVHRQRQRLRKSLLSGSTSGKSRSNEMVQGVESPESPLERTRDCEMWKACTINVAQRMHVGRAPMTFWPNWVYQMYDSYALACSAADLWRQIIGSPRLDDHIKKPDLLSFYIASKLPVADSTRQELLDIDGTSYRLRREIKILENFNLMHCESCLEFIAKRSDMVVMSSDGPLNAYVNPHGYVHEIITVYKASGLAVRGSPVKEHSWFPGYAWSIANCASCDSNMGWLFTATKKKLRPRSFWGIRSSRVADDVRTMERESR